MVKEIRVNGTKVEFEDDELAATRTLKQLSDGTYITNRLASKLITATRDMTALGGDVAYTGVGFTPTSIVAIAAMSGGVGYGFSVGFSDSVLAVGSIFASTDAVVAAGALLVDIFQAAGAYQTATIKTYDANVGFTLTWIKGGSPTGTANLKFLCFR